MINCSLVLLAMFPFTVQAPTSVPAQGCLTANESAQLEKGPKVESRLKTYASASNRFHNSLVSSASANQTDAVPPLLKCWLEVLNAAAADIDSNLERKKKSRTLREFEIQLRRAILDVQNYKIKAPVEQQDQIDDWIAKAEKIHERFMSFLFPK